MKIDDLDYINVCDTGLVSARKDSRILKYFKDGIPSVREFLNSYKNFGRTIDTKNEICGLAYLIEYKYLSKISSNYLNL